MVKDLRALSAKWHLTKSSSNSINNKLLLLNSGFMTSIAAQCCCRKYFDYEYDNELQIVAENFDHEYHVIVNCNLSFRFRRQAY
jgi:hypothetical protein